MKKFFLVYLVIMLTIDLSAQSKWGSDSINCITNLSLYREYYKQKNYTDALEPWRWTFINCPKASGNIYKNGPIIIKAKMKKDKDNKLAYVDTLMQIYDKRIEHFGKEGFVLGLKGADLLRYNKESYEEAYQILKKSINSQNNKSSAGSISAYFKSATLMEKNGKLTQQEILELYTNLSEIIDYNLLNNPKKNKFYTQTSSNVESLFTPYADCDALIGIYSVKFTDLSEDLVFLKRVVNVLDNKNCIGDDLFYRASSKLYEIEPSALSASKMSRMCISRKEYNDAIRYCKESIELEVNNDLKAKYYLGLADAYRNAGLYNESRNAVYSALKLKNGWAEAYMNLGNIYIAGASNCGSEFEQKAVYWIAVDMFSKALSDESLKARASKSINTYSKYFPSTEVCFFNNVDKDSVYKIECWINKSTRVRTSD